MEFDKNEKVIISIEKRKNFLYRPLLANIDFIGILFSVAAPKFDFIAFQKMLLNSGWQNIPVILIISKIDLVSQNEMEMFLGELKKIFKDSFPIFPISSEKAEGLENLREYIKGKSVTISGPSGTGKSTLINTLLGSDVLLTNEVSSKTSRGRHTTTESRFFKVDTNTYLIDTPGFSSLEFPKLSEKKELESLFPEFLPYTHMCKFRDCIHINEPDCKIKDLVKNSEIHKSRYEFYLYSLDNIFK